MPPSLLNASSKQHVMLLYKSQDRCNEAAIACINDGLREGQFCVYASVNAYDSSHLANLSSRITDYEQNIENGNLSIVNFRPHYESALKGDLAPFIQLKMDLEKILRQRITEGKVGKIMVFADAACFLSQNRQFAECIVLEKWWNDVHAAWIKNDQNIAVICPHPSSALMEESALYMKNQIGAQHSITIDLDKDFPLSGIKTKPMRILVAEPDMDIRNLYYAYLDSLGLDVVTVESGNKCLEFVFDSTGDGYDMIILDSHLHDICGLEVAKNIRNRIPNQSIVLTTTYPLGQIRSTLDSMGINQEDVMLKPFKFSTLLSIMKPKLAN
jgi:CheY-like chemotaxis protein